MQKWVNSICTLSLILFLTGCSGGTSSFTNLPDTNELSKSTSLFQSLDDAEKEIEAEEDETLLISSIEEKKIKTVHKLDYATATITPNQNAVTLSFDSSYFNENTFRYLLVYRYEVLEDGINKETKTLIAQLDTLEKTIIDNTIEGGKTYKYYIRAKQKKQIYVTILKKWSNPITIPNKTIRLLPSFEFETNLPPNSPVSLNNTTLFIELTSGEFITPNITPSEVWTSPNGLTSSSSFTITNSLSIESLDPTDIQSIGFYGEFNRIGSSVLYFSKNDIPYSIINDDTPAVSIYFNDILTFDIPTPSINIESKFTFLTYLPENSSINFSSDYLIGEIAIHLTNGEEVIRHLENQKFSTLFSDTVPSGSYFIMENQFSIPSINSNDINSIKFTGTFETDTHEYEFLSIPNIPFYIEPSDNQTINIDFENTLYFEPVFLN